MADWTRERIVEAAKEVAAKGDGPLLMSEFCRRAGVSDYHIYRLFPEGGWTEVRQLAGIVRHPNDKQPLSDEQLLQEFHRVVSALGAIPSRHRFASLATFGKRTVWEHFGNRQGTLV